MNNEVLKELKKQRGIVFSAVVAMAPDRIIGKDGGMPWHISEDLKLFRKLTTGHPVLMGRKTFDSLGKPLPNRQNVVLTRDASWQAEGVQVISDIAELFELDLMDDEVCIIGGAQVYDLVMPLIDLLWVSSINAKYDGDTSFPDFKAMFPYSKKVLSFADFDLLLYTQCPGFLESEYAKRASL